MKLLFLAQNVNIDADTGDSVHVRELTRSLANKGTNILLLASIVSREQKHFSLIFNSPNIIFKNSKKNNHSFLASKSSLLSYIITAYRYSPDIIYERGFSCKTGTIISKILGRPFVIEVNGLVDDELKILKRNQRHKFTKHLRLAFRKYFFLSSEKIVAVTEGIKKELEYEYGIPSEKIVVIPNGANTDLFRPMDKNKTRKDLNLCIEDKYVCFVGNLAPWQGVDYLIKAAPIVLEKVPETKFLIVGDGVMKEEWERMTKETNIERHFLFTGSVPFNVVPRYINAADICVVPKKPIKSGYSPLKLYEYMACGKPIIATNTNGFEILEENNSGLLTDSENPQELANSILKLLSNPKLMSKMGENGSRCAVEKHSWKIVSKNVFDLCDSLIRKDY